MKVKEKVEKKNKRILICRDDDKEDEEEKDEVENVAWKWKC